MEVSAINSQWERFLHQCARRAKQGIVIELDCGVTIYWTQTAWSFTNAFFMSRIVTDESDLLHRLDAIKQYVKQMQPNFPWVLFLDPERLPVDVRERSKEISLRAGFVHSMDFKCMQTVELLPPARPLPTVEVKLAKSQQDVYDAMLLNVEVYNKESSVAASVVEDHVFISDFNKQFCCTIYVDNKPVSTATTFLLDECLYVALVATTVQHRKNGYAEIVMRTSIEHAQEKLSQTKYGIVLHASDQGRSLYERLCFKEICYVERYTT